MRSRRRKKITLFFTKSRFNYEFMTFIIYSELIVLYISFQSTVMRIIFSLNSYIFKNNFKKMTNKLKSVSSGRRRWFCFFSRPESSLKFRDPKYIVNFLSPQFSWPWYNLFFFRSINIDRPLQLRLLWNCLVFGSENIIRLYRVCRGEQKYSEQRRRGFDARTKSLV